MDVSKLESFAHHILPHGFTCGTHKLDRELGSHLCFMSCLSIQFDLPGMPLKRGCNSEITSAKARHHMEGGLLFYPVIIQSFAIFNLVPCKQEPLLIRRNSCLPKDFRMHLFDCCIVASDLDSDCLSSSAFHKELNLSSHQFHLGSRQRDEQHLTNVFVCCQGAPFSSSPHPFVLKPRNCINSRRYRSEMISLHISVKFDC